MNSLNLLKALANCSKILLENKTPNTIINKVLASIGNATNVDRAYIFKNIYEQGKLNTIKYEYEWCNIGVKPNLDNDEINNLNWSQLTDLIERLSNGRSFNSLTNEIQNPIFKETLLNQKIKSIIIKPIFVDYIFWGYIGFDECKIERIWTELELFTIKSIVSNIGIYLQRNELEIKLANKQNELIKQITFFETIFNNLPADVAVFNKDHKYLFVNKNGIADPEIRKWIIGKDDFEYCEYRKKPIELAIKRREIFNHVIKTLKPYSTEEKFVTATNETKHHLRFWHPVIKNENTIEYIIGYGIEITDLKKKEGIILKQHQAIEKSPVGIALLDNKGEFYYMNKAHADLFEYTPNELYNKSWKTIYEQEEIELIENTYFPLLMSSGNWTGEVEGITKNGKKVLQNISLSSVEDGELICITRDISKIKEELEKVKLVNDQLELAMNATNMGMWNYNFEKGLFNINGTLNTIFDFNEQNLAEISYQSLIELIYFEDINRVVNSIENHTQTFAKNPSNTFRAEYRIKKKDGSLLWVLGVGKISKHDENGNPLEMIGFVLDINTQKLYDEKVNENEKRYRDLVESLKEIIFTTDLDGKCTFLNQSWEQITGYNINETLANSLINFVHPNDREVIIGLFKNLLNRKTEKINFKVRLIDASQNIIWLDFHATLHVDYIGNIIGIIGSSENITGLIEAENELEKNRAILNKVVTSIDDVIWSVDLVTDMLSYISPSCKNMTGIDDFEFYNNNDVWYNLITDQHLPLVKQSYNDFKKNIIKRREIVYKININNNKEYKWVRDKAKLSLDEFGNPSRVDGITSDITSLIIAEQNLKLSEEKYRLISENIQDVITILDIYGNISYMSPSGIKLSGFSEVDIIGSNLLKTVHRHDVKKVSNFLLNEIKPNQENKILFKSKTQKGGYKWFESIVTILNTNSREKKLLQASTRDVTSRIKAEKELTKALEKEKELSILKSRFVSMASHEFRTPLATIRSSAELIKLFIDADFKTLSPKTYSKIKEKLADITLDIDRIAELMSDILTMGKIEANRIPFNPKTLNLASFINEYLSVDAAKITLGRIINRPLDSTIKVNIDTKLMNQVLQNGIGNALKYSSNKKPIDVVIKKINNNSVITIKDYGIGIPEADLPYIFESFFRSTNVDNIPGTGLGMSIIKLFVEMHGGTVNIESKINKGTTLIITLPIAE
jgi:PAS domain S-box-containing protein